MFESKLIRRRANLIRQKDAPKMIKLVEDLAELPDAFSLIDGKEFLRYNQDSPGGRILIFASDEGLKTLKESTKWHGDGTFATSTKWFYQVYPIFASVEGSKHLVPCMFCLLPDKTEETYKVIYD